MTRLLSLILCLLPLLSACSPPEIWLRGARSGVPAVDTIALAPPVLLQDIPAALREDPFAENLTVGHLRFAGGYIVLQERGQQVRSKEVGLEAGEVWRTQALGWADEVMRRAMERRGIRYVAATLPVGSLPAPVRRDVRGTTAEDGTDNVNLPRMTLEPAPLPPEVLATLPATAPAVLVPIVVHYYSHNGGWFIGQRWGCAGGARVRLLWTLYDTRSGAVLTWADLEARSIAEGNFSPSSAQIQDLLLEVEQKVGKRLEETFLK